MGRPNHSDMLDIISEVMSTLASADMQTLDEAINASLRILGEFVGIDRAFVITFSPDKQTFTSTHEWCAPGIHSQLGYFVNLPMTVFPWTARQLLAGRVVATDRQDDYPPEAGQERQICSDEGIQSILFVPISSRGTVIGTTGFDALRQEHPWTPPEIRLLQICGAHFAACLEQRRGEQEIERCSQREREKLGQDIHDSLGQYITAISFCAGALKTQLEKRDSELAARAGEIGVQAMTALRSMRQIISGLTSFEVAGAPVACMLAQMAAETEARMGIKCQFRSRDIPEIEDPETRTQLLWITREAVNNAIRHGRASEIVIRLEPHAGKLCLTISDNGAGLPDDFLENAGIGLKVMRFRAAAMGGHVTLSPGVTSGARVRCVFPTGTGVSWTGRKRKVISATIGSVTRQRGSPS